MKAGCPSVIREVVASLMCSEFYFELPALERLALVKHLARDRSVELIYLAEALT